MNKIFPDLKLAIEDAAKQLSTCGAEVKQARWHAQDHPATMIELLNYSFIATVPEDIPSLVSLVEPNLAWAEEHFQERVSRIPHNPPPSHVRWPFAQKENGLHQKEEKFSHTYPERFWSKHGTLDMMPKNRHKVMTGLRYWHGDLDDLVGVLVFDPTTRQAYLPIWFPEDLDAAMRGERVPCTLGYHFIVRDRWIHMVYPMRSCDFVRHFRDDIYMAARLLQWVLKECQARYNEIVHPKREFNWDCVVPGTLKMDITSLHAFSNEREIVKRYKGVRQWPKPQSETLFPAPAKLIKSV